MGVLGEVRNMGGDLEPGKGPLSPSSPRQQSRWLCTGYRQKAHTKQRTRYPRQDWRGEAGTRTRTLTPQTPARIGEVKPNPEPKHVHEDHSQDLRVWVAPKHKHTHPTTQQGFGRVQPNY